MKNKIVILLLLMVLVLFLNSCSQATSSSIEGVWTITVSYNFSASDPADYSFRDGEIYAKKDSSICQGAYAKYALSGKTITISDIQLSPEDQDDKRMYLSHFYEKSYKINMSLDGNTMNWWDGIVRHTFEKQ